MIDEQVYREKRERALRALWEVMRFGCSRCAGMDDPWCRHGYTEGHDCLFEECEKVAEARARMEDANG